MNRTFWAAQKIIPLFFAALVLVASNAFAQNSPATTNDQSSFTVKFSGTASAPIEPLSFWYRLPAEKWTEALPIGNGRLGAMIFGGVNHEQLQLNEDTLWAGGPYDPNNTNALAALPKVRKLIFEGKYDEAESLIASNMMANPVHQMPYETVGDLFLDFSTNTTVENYRRDLNLDTAVASVSYTANGVNFSREFFSSPTDQVIVVRLTADKPGRISFTAGMTTPQKAAVKVESGETLVMSGINGDANDIKGALKFQARVRIVAAGGKISSSDDTISVANADSVTLYIAAATSYKNYHDLSGNPKAITKRQIAGAAGKSYDDLLTDHIAAHQILFRRVALNLGETDATDLPTDERIKHFADGHDPQLAALYFQFARYLLISSSRPGTQPANSQGIWNNSTNPPGQYTLNVNTEMNYWFAEPANLDECTKPLAAMVMDLAKTGARTAKVQYDSSGWVVHQSTDLWRATAPVGNPNSGMWPMGGASLCNQLFDNYQFTGDEKYLEQLYPAMRGAAQFFLNTLVQEPTHHWLVTCPSLSSENLHPDGNTSVCAGPTMDSEILRDLFDNCIRASELLGTDQKFAAQLAAARTQLAPLQIGSAGQLQEWLKDWDLQAKDIHHPYVSQLYGLFPSAQISLRTTPELAVAAKKSLELCGDATNGWAAAWRINLWARLHDGDHAFSILKFLLSPAHTYPDMFNANPSFQIDGNLGSASGIIEMLLQSQNGEIEFLPALPKAWPSGSVKGLRARGGFEVSISWNDGKLVSASVRSLAGNPVRLRYGETTKFINLKKGGTFVWSGK